MSESLIQTHKESFVHLHLHTQYSLLDGAIRVKDLIERATLFEMPAVAQTDHGNMFGAIDFFTQGQKGPALNPFWDQKFTLLQGIGLIARKIPDKLK